MAAITKEKYDDLIDVRNRLQKFFEDTKKISNEKPERVAAEFSLIVEQVVKPFLSENSQVNLGKMKNLLVKVKETFEQLVGFIQKGMVKPQDVPSIMRSFSAEFLSEYNAELSRVDVEKKGDQNKGIKSLEDGHLFKNLRENIKFPKDIPSGSYDVVNIPVIPLFSYFSEDTFKTLKAAGFNVHKTTAGPVLIDERILVLNSEGIFTGDKKVLTSTGEEIIEDILDSINSVSSRNYVLASKNYVSSRKNPKLKLFWIIPNSVANILKRKRIKFERWGFPI